jgi:hypothetical protein
MARHTYLGRLVNKHLTPAMLEDPKLTAFVEAVNDAFQAMERDRRVTDHAFAVSEREYQEALRKIEREDRERRRSLDQLEDALAALMRDAMPGMTSTEQEHSIELLRQVIHRSKLR